MIVVNSRYISTDVAGVKSELGFLGLGVGWWGVDDAGGLGGGGGDTKFRKQIHATVAATENCIAKPRRLRLGGMYKRSISPGLGSWSP